MTSTKLQSIVCAGLICLATGSARGQDAGPEPYTPKIIPACKVATLATGVEMCGYTSIDDVRAVYRADNELVKRRIEVELLTDKTLLLSTMIKSYQTVVEQNKIAITALKERNKDLLAEALKKNELYEKERVKPRWGNPIAWTTAVVLGAALLGYIAADQL
jgi:hypothetical protein